MLREVKSSRTISRAVAGPEPTKAMRLPDALTYGGLKHECGTTSINSEVSGSSIARWCSPERRYAHTIRPSERNA